MPSRYVPLLDTEAWRTTDDVVLFGMLYSGKWWMVSYEVFIVMASVVTLRSAPAIGGPTRSPAMRCASRLGLSSSSFSF